MEATPGQVFDDEFYDGRRFIIFLFEDDKAEPWTVRSIQGTNLFTFDLTYDENQEEVPETIEVLTPPINYRLKDYIEPPRIQIGRRMLLCFRVSSKSTAPRKSMVYLSPILKGVYFSSRKQNFTPEE